MKVILRDENNELGRRKLIARIEENGDLVFDGWDLGKGVKGLMGSSEYEWLWTVKAPDVPLFEKALSSDFPLLEAIEKRFHGDAASTVNVFMEEHHIEYEMWSRVGD